MNNRTCFRYLGLAVFTFLLTGLCTAQTPASVPTMVKFSGTVHEAPSRIVGITFALYKDEQGGAPLWMETQSVLLDGTGHYTVQLGSTLPAGLPKELFASGEARWLGITPEGQQEQARVLLLSVPYALKAADAETIGGLPASAFVLKGQRGTQATVVTKKNAKVFAPNTPPPAGSLNVTTGGGIVNTLPLFNTSTDIESSMVSQSAMGIGINTSTPATLLDVNGNATVRGTLNVTTAYQFNNVYWGYGNWNLGNAFDGFGGNLFGTGGGGVQNTAMGASALSAASLTGRDDTALGYLALQANTSGADNTAMGAFTLFKNTSGGQDTAIGFNALASNNGSENTAIGNDALDSNTTGSGNTAVGGETLVVTTTGNDQTAVGWTALQKSTGNYNSGLGAEALINNTTGISNTAVGFGTLFSNTTGSYNTAIGLSAGTDSSTPNLTNATAIGANADVKASNSMVLGSIAGVNGASNDTNVGIGTTTPVAKLHIGSPSVPGTISLRVEGPSAVGTGAPAISVGGFGDFGIDKPFVPEGRFVVKENGLVGINTSAPDVALSVNGNADKPGGGSWLAFSDRRLKNLDGDFSSGLNQIMKIKPIRYRYKNGNGMNIQDNGEHVGLVAQEVQKVIPEAVTENSRGYLLVNNDPIIWAMLNAIKEQQREIRKERSVVRAQQAAIRDLQSQLKETRQNLATIKTKMDTSPDAAVLGSR